MSGLPQHTSLDGNTERVSTTPMQPAFFSYGLIKIRSWVGKGFRWSASAFWCGARHPEQEGFLSCFTLTRTGQFGHDESKDKSENENQRDQDDLGHAHIPEIEPQADDLGILKDKDQDKRRNNKGPNDFRFHAVNPPIRWRSLPFLFRGGSPLGVPNR
jgi:hypothetical protein